MPENICKKHARGGVNLSGRPAGDRLRPRESNFLEKMRVYTLTKILKCA